MEWFVYTPAFIFAVFLLLFLVEKFFPLRESRAGLLARLLVNGALSGLVFLVAMLTVRPSALSARDWSAVHSFGLMQWLNGPVWLEGVLSFLLLDLSFYYWHLLNHKVPILWRFHNVHHIDPALDVSTGFRFHFGEVLLSSIFRVVQVVVIGVSLPAFLVYEAVFQAGTLFHHSNLRLPITLERWLNKLFVTPRMHGIHHSQVHRETDSNYGVVFSFWDRLHRTLGLNIRQAAIQIGVPGYASAGDNQFWRILAMPFARQREYWRRADGTAPERAVEDRAPARNVLAE